MTRDTIELEILRYNPETDEAPEFRVYKIPFNEDWVILDAINYVKDKLDRTLSYRWSCHMAVCGSCGMMVNGEPTLACKAFISDYGERIRIEPLGNFPIERDLVVGMDDFMKKLESVKPYIVPKDEVPAPAVESLQSPEQLDKFKQHTLCINCTLCYAACPQYALNRDFVGPGALNLAHRYNLDSRDRGREVRADVVASNEGIWECSFVGACSEVCPADADPAAAIQQMKIASTADYFKEMLTPWRRR